MQNTNDMKQQMKSSAYHLKPAEIKKLILSTNCIIQPPPIYHPRFRKKVEKATNGKVGYIHIPDMSIGGLNQFVKTWFAQLRKDGIIVDARFNGGGFVSQAILEKMIRKILDYTMYRWIGEDTYPMDFNFISSIFLKIPYTYSANADTP